MPLDLTIPAQIQESEINEDGMIVIEIQPDSGFGFEDNDGDGLTLDAFWLEKTTDSEGVDVIYGEGVAGSTPDWVTATLVEKTLGPPSGYNLALTINESTLDGSMALIWFGARVSDGQNPVEAAIVYCPIGFDFPAGVANGIMIGAGGKLIQYNADGTGETVFRTPVAGAAEYVKVGANFYYLTPTALKKVGANLAADTVVCGLSNATAMCAGPAGFMLVNDYSLGRLYKVELATGTKTQIAAFANLTSISYSAVLDRIFIGKQGQGIVEAFMDNSATVEFNAERADEMVIDDETGFLWAIDPFGTGGGRIYKIPMSTGISAGNYSVANSFMFQRGAAIDSAGRKIYIVYDGGPGYIVRTFDLDTFAMSGDLFTSAISPTVFGISLLF